MREESTPASFLPLPDPPGKQSPTRRGHLCACSAPFRQAVPSLPVPMLDPVMLRTRSLPLCPWPEGVTLSHPNWSSSLCRAGVSQSSECLSSGRQSPGQTRVHARQDASVAQATRARSAQASATAVCSLCLLLGPHFFLALRACDGARGLSAFSPSDGCFPQSQALTPLSHTHVHAHACNAHSRSRAHTQGCSSWYYLLLCCSQPLLGSVWPVTPLPQGWWPPPPRRREGRRPQALSGHNGLGWGTWREPDVSQQFLPLAVGGGTPHCPPLPCPSLMRKL